MKLLNELREKLGFAMVFVSHDLALVAQLAHHITVMYAGTSGRNGTNILIAANPTHEYTVAYWVLYFQLKSVQNVYIKFRAAYHRLTILLRVTVLQVVHCDQMQIRSKIGINRCEGEPSHLWAFI